MATKKNDAGTAAPAYPEGAEVPKAILTAQQEEQARDAQRFSALEEATAAARAGTDVRGNLGTADSGYRLPEGFGTVSADLDPARYPSAERESGDGGRASTKARPGPSDNK